MRGQRGQMGQAATAKVRLDAGGAAGFSASVQPTACFDRLLPAESAICRCLTRSKGGSWRKTGGNLAKVGLRKGAIVNLTCRTPPSLGSSTDEDISPHHGFNRRRSIVC